jgi:hypothetical protein
VTVLGMLGMTAGELELVAFVFGLVYAAAFVPRFGAFVGRKLAGDGGPGSKTGSTTRGE